MMPAPAARNIDAILCRKRSPQQFYHSSRPKLLDWTSTEVLDVGADRNKHGSYSVLVSGDSQAICEQVILLTTRLSVHAHATCHYFP